uniref:Ovule protein n=1 Tax=Steinernema glaseri TaxID=37863 RepID=A0A1I8ANG2_9BILA
MFRSGLLVPYSGPSTNKSPLVLTGLLHSENTESPKHIIFFLHTERVPGARNTKKQRENIGALTGNETPTTSEHKRVPRGFPATARARLQLRN